VDATGGGLQHGARVAVDDAPDGRWRLELDADAPTTVAVRTTRVIADGTPSPTPVLGYEQRPYEVTPLSYLDAYGDALASGDVASESVDAVANGALLDGGSPAVDTLVIPHDDGVNDAAYVDAVESFVDAGGRLVVTDTGTRLLGALDAGGASAIRSSDVRRVTRNAATLERKQGGPLLDGVRSIETEIWKATPLGYRTRNEAELSLVDESAFRSAGGDVAATTGGDVVLGELDGIAVVGSLLPAPGQGNLHPFGLYGSALSSMGHQLLVNALGHEQPAASGGASQ
jgi:hypothetical protein